MDVHSSVLCVLLLASMLKISVLCQVTEDCQEPTHQALVKQLQNARNTNRHHLILISNGSASSNWISNHTTRTPIDWDIRCPATLQALDNSPNSLVKDRSVCPYYYEIETDQYRFPKSITRAVCKCQYCLEDQGLSSSNVCEPVYTPEVVLRREGCVDGVYRYTSVEINRQIACLCARMREITVSTSTDATATLDGPSPVA